MKRRAHGIAALALILHGGGKLSTVSGELSPALETRCANSQMAGAALTDSDYSGAKQISARLAAALGAGDLEAATACFARDGCLVTPGATAIRGRERIRAILGQLIAMHPGVELEQRGMLVSGDVALATETWTIRLGGLDLTPFARTADSTAVLRRVEGAWRLQIAAPWGWG